MTSASGSVDRFYDVLGEVVKEVRHVTSDKKNQNGPLDYTTEFTYDTFGRMQNMTYPDGEKLTYQYDSGGLVRNATGDRRGKEYLYVLRLEYDKFEQRMYQANGNGTKSLYSYIPTNRRLLELKHALNNNKPFADLNYTYDFVGNIMTLNNTAPIQARNLGGISLQSFAYDNLYRLTTAGGTFRGFDNLGHSHEAKYTLAMQYDTIHNITKKTQTTFNKAAGDRAWTQEKKGTYDFGYAYAGTQPHAPTTIGERTYTYDLNGNQTSFHSPQNVDRALTWDEENRLHDVLEHGNDPSKSGVEFVYDDAGERVIKRTNQQFSIYVNQFFTVRGASNQTKGMLLSKHIFMGNTRIITVMDPGGFLAGSKQDPRTVPRGTGAAKNNNMLIVTAAEAEIHKGASPSSQTWGTVVQCQMLLALDQVLHGGDMRRVQFGDKDGYILASQVTDSAFSGCDEASGSLIDGFSFYYHPDHLGSVGNMTDSTGRVSSSATIRVMLILLKHSPSFLRA